LDEDHRDKLSTGKPVTSWGKTVYSLGTEEFLIEKSTITREDRRTTAGKEDEKFFRKIR